MQPKLLEVLIPTFARPRLALRAVRSVVDAGGDKVLVHCSSNRPEPGLRAELESMPNVKYSEFPLNQGVKKNLQFLLESCNAEFCMFLSDEDRVRADALKSFLGELSSCSAQVHVGLVSVRGLATGATSFRPRAYLSGRLLDLKSFIALGPLSTYISGVTFSQSAIRDNMFSFPHIFREKSGNAYSHLRLMENCLKGGAFLLVSGQCVVESGPSAGFGGELEDGKEAGMLGELGNMAIYGQEGRMAQFLFEIEHLTSLRENSGRWAIELRILRQLLRLRRQISFFLDRQVSIAEFETLPAPSSGVESLLSQLKAMPRGRFYADILSHKKSARWQSVVLRLLTRTLGGYYALRVVFKNCWFAIDTPVPSKPSS